LREPDAAGSRGAAHTTLLPSARTLTALQTWQDARRGWR
jgi:hypothetical protein